MSNTTINREWPVLLKKELDKSIVGQNAYKEAISIGIYRQLAIGYVGPILVMGPTGSGKTFMMQCLKKTKICPEQYTIMMTNVSRLTEEGVKGPDVDDIFNEYSKLCKLENNKTYRGIIYIDEMDKLISPSFVTDGVGGETNRNAAVQHQLMQILDGGVIAGVPTEKILFVFGGAFHQLNDYCNKERHKPIGFCAPETEPQGVLRECSIRDKMISIGFQREFLGRISQIIELEALNRNELTAVLMHPTKGVIPKLQKEYLKDGIELRFATEAVEEILKAVLQENLGARSVNNIMEKVLSGALFKCFEKNYTKIIVDKDAIATGELKYEKNCSQVMS